MAHYSNYNYYKPKVVYTLKKKCSSNKFSLNFSEENKQYRNLSYFSYFYLLFYPTPSNLTSFWNFGFLSFIFLFIQIITGIFLSMHYVAEAAYAFDSVAQIMRDVEYGWLARYMHANGASFFFFLVYLHMGRSMYNFSYLLPRRAAWSIGVLIYFLMILTAFTGYVLPWGQMSFWAATVITNLTSAVPIFGQSIVTWLWGGYSVSTVTLNRFFSIHYLLPFIIFALVIIHVIVLHHKGSSNRLGVFYSSDKIRFGPYYLIKDFVALLITLDIYFFFVGFYPNVLGHPDNFIKADPLVTPAHIVPEWYFLPFYAMLRSIPSKLIGVIILFLAILVLFAFPFFLSSKTIAGFTKRLDYNEILFSKIDKTKKPFIKSIFWWVWKYRLYILFWFFADIVILLGILGAKPIEYPYYGIGQVLTFFYFFYFFLLVILFDERLLNNSKIKKN